MRDAKIAVMQRISLADITYVLSKTTLRHSDAAQGETIFEI